MKFTRKQKLMLFMFGTADRLLTADNLQGAAMLVGEESLGVEMLFLCDELQNPNVNEDEYAVAYYLARDEVKRMLVAPSFCINHETGDYKRIYPMQDLMKSFIVANFTFHSVQDSINDLELLKFCILNILTKETVDEVIADIRAYAAHEPMMYGEYVDGHKKIIDALVWLTSEGSADETHKV